MFEIGDFVKVGSDKVGKIVNWFFDEGNVWAVECDGETLDYSDNELTTI
jgi:hypothetical protein